MIYGRVLSAFMVGLFVFSLTAIPSLCGEKASSWTHHHSTECEGSDMCHLKAQEMEDECNRNGSDSVICCSHTGSGGSDLSINDIQFITADISMPVYGHSVRTVPMPPLSWPQGLQAGLFKPPRPG